MRGFREVGWVAAVAGTALGCYMVNLKVASERATLEDVETRIVLAQRDIRVLQTEIGTRGRLEQLESWNAKVLALSAPQAHQFLEGEFQLATLTKPDETEDPAAPVVLASAPRPAENGDAADTTPRSANGRSPRDLMQVASLKRDLPTSAPAPEKAVDKPKPATAKLVATVPKAATPASKPKPKPRAEDAPAAKAVSASRVAASGVKVPVKPAVKPASAPKPKPAQAGAGASKDSKARR